MVLDYYLPIKPIFLSLLTLKEEFTNSSESELNDEEEDLSSPTVIFFFAILSKRDAGAALGRLLSFGWSALTLAEPLAEPQAEPLAEPLAEPFGLCLSAPPKSPFIYKLLRAAN